MTNADDRIRLATTEGRVKRILVNKHIIKANKKPDVCAPRPALTVQTSAGPLNAHRVVINGPSEVVYSPGKPLGCGGEAWVETTAALELEE